MSKKNKKKQPEPKKEEPKSKMPWWGPYAGISIILMIIHSILHPGGTTVTGNSSSPRPPDGLVRIERWDWISPRPGQPKELLPVITAEDGRQYAVPRSRLQGPIAPESQWLITPKAPSTQYTVLTSSY